MNAFLFIPLTFVLSFRIHFAQRSDLPPTTSKIITFILTTSKKMLKDYLEQTFTAIYYRVELCGSCPFTHQMVALSQLNKTKSQRQT